MKNKTLRLIIVAIEQSLKEKYFIILNVIMLLGVIFFINFGTIKEIIKFDKKDKKTDIVVIDETNKFYDKYIKENGNNITVVKEFDVSNLHDKQAVVSIKYNIDSVLDVSVTSKEYISSKEYASIQKIINEIKDSELQNKYNIDNNIKNQLLSSVKINKIITSEFESDYDKNSIHVQILNMLAYMLTIFVVSIIASTIGMEKISKTTEYMLTGISDKSYLWYNILQANIIIVFQAILSGIYLLIATSIKSILSFKFLNISMGDITGNLNVILDPVLVKFYFVGFILLILTFFILSIIQALLTSKVSNMTDISNSTMVLLMVIIGLSFGGEFLVKQGDITFITNIIASLPVISLFTTPKLILLGSISNLQIIITIVIGILTLVVLSIIGGKIFKKGLLGQVSNKKVDKNKKEAINIDKIMFKNTIFKVAFSMLLFFCISNILGLILSVFNLSYTLNQVFTILVFVISLLIPFIYLNDKKLFNNKLSNNKISKINYKYIFMGMPPLIILQIISTFISKKLNIEVDIINLIKIDISNITNIILFILFIAVLPAIFEELFFRHAMLSKLKKFGSINAIVITAVMFGLMHLNLTQGIFAVFTGILFGYIAIKCNSVKETMILHLLNNLFAALSFIFMSYNLVIGLVILALVYIVITAIGVVILNINLYKDHTKFYITDKNTKVGMYLFKDYIVVLTLIIYILMTVYMTMILV